MSLQGKTALVTGSSRGIGKAIAIALAKAGCNIILNAATSSEELVRTQNELKDMGYFSYSYLADVSDFNQCKEMFDKIYSLYSNIDILVNNAGISIVGLFTETTPSDWDNIMRNNVNSVLNCTYLAVPQMVRKKSGSIINISSIWGDRGASCEALYSASKGAVNSFTKAMAKELGPSQIRVNAISCGVIQTKMLDFLSDDEKEVLTNEISLMRIGSPEEIAQVALFLADNRSEFLTGQVITVDGCMF